MQVYPLSITKITLLRNCGDEFYFLTYTKEEEPQLPFRYFSTVGILALFLCLVSCDEETFSKAKPPPTDDSPPFDPPSNSPPTDFVSSFDATATSDNQIFRSALRDSSSSVDWLGREMFEMRPRERLVMWRPRDKVDHDDDDDKPLFLEESGVAQLVDIIKVVLLPLLSFIGKVTTSSTLPLSQEASNFDEVYVQQSLLFDDSLRDLKNLRTQLYSAAEYFELSYTNDDQKQIVVETLKDYAIKALANTVDHLGTVTYRVNDLLDEKVVEVSGVEQLGRP